LTSRHLPPPSGTASAKVSGSQSLTPVEGVEIEVGPAAVWVRSQAPLSVLGSAVVGGDLDATQHVVNMHVSRDYASDDPGADLRAFARRLGIRDPFVGLMTAAWTDRASVAWEEADGIRAGVVATVGLSRPAAAGVCSPVAWRPSTINLIAVLDARLERGAAVNGVITVTEAKVGALVEAGVVTAEGVQATGTVTDAVVIAWTGRGPRAPYLGPGTVAGWCLARAARRAVLECIPAR
jgi:iron complex transport system ATP-binding protein